MGLYGSLPPSFSPCLLFLVLFLSSFLNFLCYYQSIYLCICYLYTLVRRKIFLYFLRICYLSLWWKQNRLNDRKKANVLRTVIPLNTLMFPSKDHAQESDLMCMVFRWEHESQISRFPSCLSPDSSYHFPFNINYLWSLFPLHQGLETQSISQGRTAEVWNFGKGFFFGAVIYHPAKKTMFLIALSRFCMTHQQAE